VKTISQYCQKCRTPNEPGAANCRACGTRLMLVVFPPSMRHDESVVPSYYEDHLLERVSLLELRLVQMSEQLKMAYEFISREAKSFQKDHQLLQAFFEAMERLNPDLTNEISRQTLEIRDRKAAAKEAKNKDELLLNDIFESHDNQQSELFTHLVKEGIKNLKENEEKLAFLNLERALLLSSENVPLYIFIAESYFRADRFSEAKKILEKAYKVAPHNEKILMLFGAVSADVSENENARKYLSFLAGIPKYTGCVNFIWGMLAASEHGWAESIAAFKETANLSETAEIHYLIGCAYFQTGQIDNALGYFQKAVLINENFADAWFMQSVVYYKFGDNAEMEKMRQSALEVKEAGAQCLEFLRKKKMPELETALPFLHFNQENKILSKGALRLTKFFREQVLKAIE